MCGVGGQELGAAGCALFVLAFEVLDFDVLERGLPLRVGSWVVLGDYRVCEGGGGGERFLFF